MTPTLLLMAWASKLKHLPHYNDIGKHNGRFLTEELCKIKGLIPPLMLSDWTSMLEREGWEKEW